MIKWGKRRGLLRGHRPPGQADCAEAINERAATKRLLTSVSLLPIGLVCAIGLSSQAYAQAPVSAESPAAPTAGEPASSTAAKGGAVSDIVVTGSRIVRNGYQAPTPTTVLSIEEIQRNAPINIADEVNTLPSLAGSSRNVTASISGGGIGVNSLNLRNLGVTRTLILLDGERMPAATTGGAVDVNSIPNALVKRVDIVTGGASAAWGSDAVAGVVNFVLDKDFTGIKGEASGGVTTYGDDSNYKFSLAGGTRFAGGRGHAMFSVEAEDSNGVSGNTRPWYTGAKQLFNPAYTATNGQPQLLVRQNVGYTTLAPGGIVTAGPLKGLMFGANGAQSQLQLGSIVSDPLMVGGDWRATDFATNSEDLDPKIDRQAVFGRVSYDLTDNINVYGQLMYTRTHVFSESTPEYMFSNITLQRDNAYLPANVVSTLQANNLSSVTLGSWLQSIGYTPYTTNREMFRSVLGADGRFNLFGKDWTWDAFWNRNSNDVNQNTQVTKNAAFANAIDAVSLNGQIVCRSTLTNPTNGCAPFNVLGTNVASQAAKNYVLGTTNLNNVFEENEVSGTLHGEPFSLWAGPVSVAAGIEHRTESSTGTNDPLSQTNGYFYGNYKPIKGSYSVTEGFFETVVPLARDLPFARSIDFNGAVRETDYSTSGMVTTWKVGGVWKIVDDFTFRATKSFDIRAGNLTDLYQPGRTANATINDPARNNQSYLALTSTIGNTTIQPEQANSINLGGVFQPHFIPGLSASVDYWNTDVTNVISTLSATNLLNSCYSGATSLCQYIARDPSTGLITTITLKPVNLAEQKASGIDFEASYQMPVHTPLGSGNIVLRGLATHFLQNVTYSGIAGSIPNSTLGSAFGTPFWRYKFEGTYNQGPFSGSMAVRGISDGLLNPTYVQCSASCPVSTTNYRTIDNNHVDGEYYFDLALSYKFKPGLETFLAIDNLMNAYPSQVADTTSVGSAQWGASPVYYDLIGRTFRGGIRFKF